MVVSLHTSATRTYNVGVMRGWLSALLTDMLTSGQSFSRKGSACYSAGGGCVARVDKRGAGLIRGVQWAEWGEGGKGRGDRKSCLNSNVFSCFFLFFTMCFSCSLWLCSRQVEICNSLLYTGRYFACHVETRMSLLWAGVVKRSEYKGKINKWITGEKMVWIE